MVRYYQPEWGKDWIKVEFDFPHSTWIPSFRDMQLIVKAICEVEEDKYVRGLGRFKVADFLADCCRGMEWDWLKRHYEIPEREGEPSP